MQSWEESCVEAPVEPEAQGRHSQGAAGLEAVPQEKLAPHKTVCVWVSSTLLDCITHELKCDDLWY